MKVKFLCVLIDDVGDGCVECVGVVVMCDWDVWCYVWGEDFEGDCVGGGVCCCGCGVVGVCDG